MISELTGIDNYKSIEDMMRMSVEKALSEQCICHCVFMLKEMYHAIESFNLIPGVPVSMSEKSNEFLLGNGSSLFVQTASEMSEQVGRDADDEMKRFLFIHMVNSWELNNTIVDCTIRPYRFEEIHAIFNISIIGSIKDKVSFRVEQNQKDFSSQYPTFGTYDLFEAMYSMTVILYDHVFDKREHSEVVKYGEGVRWMCEKCLGKKRTTCRDIPMNRCLLFGDNLIVGGGCRYFPEMVMYKLNGMGK